MSPGWTVREMVGLSGTTDLALIRGIYSAIYIVLYCCLTEPDSIGPKHFGSPGLLILGAPGLANFAQASGPAFMIKHQKSVCLPSKCAVCRCLVDNCSEYPNLPYSDLIRGNVLRGGGLENRRRATFIQWRFTVESSCGIFSGYNGLGNRCSPDNRGKLKDAMFRREKIGYRENSGTPRIDRILS